MVALGALTFGVLLLIPVARFRAAFTLGTFPRGALLSVPPNGAR